MKSVAVSKSVAEMSVELRQLQRQRAVTLKSRNMQGNRIQAVVAGTLGYHSSMAEKDRTRVFKDATTLIKGVVDGTAESPFKHVILGTMVGIKAFNDLLDELEKKMVAAAKLLPVAHWATWPDQRGFGLLSLATVIGETGDLSAYANPAKVWRRMGCAPWTFNPTGEEDGAKTLMGATWRGGKEGKLPASEWEAYGYSPRRRSIAYLVGENLIKLNGKGPYRRRWLEAKVRAYELHPEWTWADCVGSSKEDACKGADCLTCGGTGKKSLRAHRHGMLVATKLLFKRLWARWNGCSEHTKWLDTSVLVEGS